MLPYTEKTATNLLTTASFMIPNGDCTIFFLKLIILLIFTY
jgi:hypothetical protein